MEEVKPSQPKKMKLGLGEQGTLNKMDIANEGEYETPNKGKVSTLNMFIFIWCMFYYYYELICTNI